MLFDVDGTLVDSLDLIVKGLGDTVETFIGRRPSEEEIRRLIGIPLRKQLRMYGVETISRERIEEMNAYAIQRFEDLKDSERLFLPAIEALRVSYESGMKTAIVTSKSSQELGPFLKRFPGASYLHTTVCSTDVLHPKPEPESALLACKRLGVRPEDAVFIGDSVYDLRCARAAGMANVAVAYGSGHRDALYAESPDLLLDTPEALLDWAEAAFIQPSCREKS